MDLTLTSVAYVSERVFTKLQLCTIQITYSHIHILKLDIVGFV